MKKIILIVLMAMISSFSYYGAVNENGEKVVDFNTTSQEENIVEEQAEEIQEDITSQEENTIAQAEVIQQEETKVEDTVDEKSKTSVTENKSQNDNKGKTTQTQQKQADTSVAETQTTQPVTKTLTPDDLEYWCVAGGTHHIAGDGANEHGYYASWNEANQAFENYTKGWESVQYKIDHCSCGKYYFWAIK